MNKLLSALLLLFISFFSLATADENKPRVIRVTAASLPAEGEAMTSFLWSLQERNSEPWMKPFHDAGSRGWASRYGECSRQLLSEILKTGDAKPEIESIFVKILVENSEGLALIPYVVYEVTAPEGRIWVVQCAWERPVPESPDSRLRVEGIADKETRDHLLIHVRLWAFRESDFEIVGFSTCL